MTTDRRMSPSARRRARSQAAGGSDPALIAFFSMEVAIDDAMPTFSGGLGVLAGDFLRSAADLSLPLIGVTLMYRKGYFTQSLDDAGRQTEAPVGWSPEAVLEPLGPRTTVEVNGREVGIKAWRRVVEGVSGARASLYLLDTDLEENAPADREITDRLYGGDQGHRLRQEIVLGVGGLAMLEALGYRASIFHMNEGHCSLLTLGLLESEMAASSDRRSDPTDDDVEAVRARCKFTTHTPVAAGHDRFPVDLVRSVLGPRRSELLSKIGCLEDNTLNMTELALRLSGFANAVSLRHREVSRRLFPEARLASITNGVHLGTWVAPAMGRVFDEQVPGWRADNSLLRYVGRTDVDQLAEAHRESKRMLVELVQRSARRSLDREALTVGLARRATSYKRTTLVFSDLDRLREIAARYGPLQIICSGKAHPNDEAGKELISRVFLAASALRGQVEVVFLEGYDLQIAKLLCAGSDLWLNTPERPYEASGTSGMKAAANGVPSLSVLDGWWVEGCIDGVTGWAIGGLDPGATVGAESEGAEDPDDAEALYSTLGEVICPMFYGERERFLSISRSCIALNATFFNGERMVREYATSAYGIMNVPWMG
jgi:glycogen phosphorylase